MNPSHNKQAQAVSLKRRFFSAPTLVSFAIAATFISFLAVRFNVDWGVTWDNIRGLNPWLYLVAILAYYLSFAFRGLRWRILAQNAEYRSSPEARLPSVPQFSQLIIIGWFVNAITWFRLGDAYRSYALAEDSGGSFPWSLGTVLAERVLDMAIILGLLVVGAIFLTTTRDSSTSNYILIAASGMAFVLVALLLAMKVLGVRLARFLPHRFEVAYNRFHRGALGSFKQLPALVALGLMGWILEMARLYFVVQALDLRISLALVAVVALGHAILSTIPTPGGIGAVEPGVTGLLLLGLDRHDAVAVTLVDRSITYVSVVVIGLLVFSLRQVARARRNRNQVLSTKVSSGERTAADV